MHIVSASHLLASSVSVVIACQMAAVLVRRHADLGSSAAVTNTLREAGFGLPTINALSCKAKRIAISLMMTQRGRLQ